MTPVRRLSLIITAALLGLLFAAAYGLLATEAGLRLVVERVNTLGAVRLSAGALRGTLLGPLEAESLHVETPAARIRAARAQLDWRPLALLRGRVRLDGVELHGLEVTLLAQGDVPRERRAPPALPLSLGLKGAVHGLTVRGAEGDTLVELAALAVDGVLHTDLDITLRNVTATHPHGSLEVTGRLGLRADAEVALDTRWLARLPGGGAPLHGAGTVRGVPTRFAVDQQLQAPWRGRLQAQVDLEPSPFTWAATLALEPASLTTLAPHWRAVGLGGHLSGRGAGGDLTLEAELEIDDPAAGPWTGKAEVQHSATGWRLPGLTLTQQDGPGRIDASGRFARTGTPSVELSLAWRDLGWPVAAPHTRSPRGALDVRGRPDAYTLTGDAVLVQTGRPPGQVRLAGRGDLGQLALERFSADWLGGQLRGQGAVQWSPEASARAELVVAGIDPGQLAPAWSGRVDAQLAVAAAWGAQPGWRIDVHALGGRLRGQALTGRGRLDWRPERLVIDDLALGLGKARIAATGTWAEAASDLRFDAVAPDLARLLPEARGRLRASARLSGSAVAPQLAAEIDGTGLGWQRYRLEALDARAALDMSGNGASSLRAQARGLAADELAIASLTLAGEGRPAGHRLHLEAGLAAGSVQVAAEGRYADGRWQGVLRDGAWRGATGPWDQQQTAALAVAADGVRLDPLCWAQGAARLCLSGHGDVQGLSAEASVAGAPMALFNPFLPRRELRVSGALDGRVALAYRDGLQHLRAELRAGHGDLRLDLPGDEALTSTYREAVFEATGDDDGLAVGASLALEGGDFMRLEAHLPDWRPGAVIGDELPLNGRAEASLRQLMWISLFIPEVIVPSGRLTADLTLTGRLGQPVLDGRLALEEGVVAIPLLGIQLAELRLRTRGGAAGRMEVLASARSGPGRAAVEGTVQRAEDGWQADLRVQGEDFQVVRLPMGEALASPELRIGVRPDRVRLSGQLTVPRARVNLADLTAPVSASPDVVVINGDAAPEAPRWLTESEVEVVLGDAVQVSGYGLEASLGGRLTVIEPARGPAIARGEVRVREGKYEAYGQRLNVAVGRLYYANMPLGNPGIDVRAVRTVEQVTVGIVATGRLRSAELRLYSEPPMDDSQILAYLVIGRALETASREEADLLQRAALSLGLSGGSRLTEDLAGELGVDVLEVETSTQHQEASVVLGKYLSPRLYVQYAVGLFETQDSLRVRYSLSEHWTLEAQSGARAGGDLLYTIER